MLPLALVATTLSAPAQRVANPAISVPATPPPLTYRFVEAVTGLSTPVAVATPPGETKRVFIVQKGGRLRLVPDITVPSPSFVEVLNISSSTGGLLNGRSPSETLSTSSEQGFLGLAFHPQFATNGHMFVFYSVTTGGNTYERISRLTLQNHLGNAPTVVPASEVVLIQQLDEASNHNGGDLHFGPDGYLYAALGDEGNQNDSLNNSQRIDKDFFSGLIRLDVDKKPGSLAPNPHAAIPTDGGVARFAVPTDNPWVHTSLGGTWDGTFNGSTVSNLSAVRTEFWAVGMRNPWRFSFDAPTGDLWLGDVGQDTYEEIDIVTKGANLGWAYREGAHNGAKAGSAPANFDALHHSPPLYEYVHTGVSGGSANFKGNSVSGGVVYRGTRFPALAGRYIFADYVSGHVWALQRNGAAAPTVTWLGTETGLVAFGHDPSNGDVLMVDGSRLHRLVVETSTTTYPGTLSETGLFADVATLSPAAIVVPYEVNLPFWSDHAIKRRWFTIPDGTSRMTWSREGAWTFPAGQIWVKHFDLETTRGEPATTKRLETRVLVKNATGAYGVSYRWNEAGTEATLVEDGGDEFDVPVTVNGTLTTQRWRIPSRGECLSCHTPQAGHALSFNTRQMNLGTQLADLAAAGYFTNAVESANVLPRHLRGNETDFPVEARVRSWLAVNCAYCHQDGGTAAPSAWDGRSHLTLAETGLVNGAATNNGGDPANKLVVPGDAAHSVLLNRVAVTNGFTRMPPLASNVVDADAVALLTEWITQALPARKTYADWRLDEFGSASSAEGEPDQDPDGDGADNAAEFLAGTDPQDATDVLRPELTLDPAGTLTLHADVPPNRTLTIESSSDLGTWTLWDVPGNHGLPTTGAPVILTGPSDGTRQFFRMNLREN